MIRQSLANIMTKCLSQKFNATEKGKDIPNMPQRHIRNTVVSQVSSPFVMLMIILVAIIFDHLSFHNSIRSQTPIFLQLDDWGIYRRVHSNLQLLPYEVHIPIPQKITSDMTVYIKGK